uniref:Layilin n=1 Tax=Camelus bactrianus TaxID=9837 RepID=A0A9W3H7K1_CAMBA|nr:layilin [Camelus bactrianus]
MAISGSGSGGVRRNGATARPAGTFMPGPTGAQQHLGWVLGSSWIGHGDRERILLSLCVAAIPATTATPGLLDYVAQGANLLTPQPRTASEPFSARGPTQRQLSFMSADKRAKQNWYVDEPSCGSEICVVMYHQPSAPAGIGGPYMFQWNDDRCTMRNNFICKYSDEKPTAPSTRPGGEGTEPATPILPEDTEKEDATETLKESKEAALNLAYILIPSIPLLLLLVVTAGVCWVWICRRRSREQPGPSSKAQHPRWPAAQPGNSPDLEVYNVIRKQSEADLADTRPDAKNVSFRVRSGEATPDAVSCDYDNMAVNPSESGFVTLVSVEGGFVTNDVYEFSPDRAGRSKESGWVENEIYGY